MEFKKIKSPTINSLLLNAENFSKGNFVKNSLEVNYANKTTAATTTEGIGPVINGSETFSHMYLLESDELFGKLARTGLKEIAENLKKDGEKVEFNPCKNIGVKYVCLQAISFNVNGKAQNVIYVNELVQKAWCISVFKSDLNNIDNLRNIIKDANVLMRLCGERTIDAVKKLYKVVYNLLLRKMRSLSTIHLDSNVDYLSFKANNELEITRKTKYSDLNTHDFANGPFVQRNKDNEISMLIFEDFLGAIQNTLVKEYTSFINGPVKQLYNNIGVDATIPEQLGNLYHFALDCKRLFGTLYAEMYKDNIEKTDELNKQRLFMDEDVYLDEVCNLKEEIKEDLAELGNMYVGYMVANNISIEDAGLISYVISNYRIGKDGMFIPTEYTNSFFLKVAPELYSCYLAKVNNKAIAKTELFGKGNLINGSIATMVNGKIDNYQAIDSKYTGTVIIEVVNDKVYATNSINNMLLPDYVRTVCNRKSISVWNKSFIDITKLNNGKWGYTDDDSILIEMVREGAQFIVMPQLTFAINGVPRIEKNILVAKLNGNTIPVCKYSCISNELEENIAGSVFTDVDILETNNNIILLFEADSVITVNRNNHNITRIDKIFGDDIAAEYGVIEETVDSFNDFNDAFATTPSNPAQTTDIDDVTPDAFGDIFDAFQ